MSRCFIYQNIILKCVCLEMQWKPVLSNIGRFGIRRGLRGKILELIKYLCVIPYMEDDMHTSWKALPVQRERVQQDVFPWLFKIFSGEGDDDGTGLWGLVAWTVQMKAVFFYSAIRTPMAFTPIRWETENALVCERKVDRERFLIVYFLLLNSIIFKPIP